MDCRHRRLASPTDISRTSPTSSEIAILTPAGPREKPARAARSGSGSAYPLTPSVCQSTLCS